MTPAPEDLFAALDRGDGDALSALLAERSDLAGARRADGLPAVHAALYARRQDLADRLLLARPALDAFDAAAAGDDGRLAEDPERARERSSDGFTALHLTAFFARPACAALALRCGADPDAVASDGSLLRPLHSAAASRSADIARMLLDAGADPDARQQGGFTALHAAALHGDLALAELLLERGADPALATDAGESAADLARRGHAPLLALLDARRAASG